MPRLQLKKLGAYEYSFEITVRTTDLNYGGHLGNDRLLSLLHEARVAWLAHHQWTELSCGGSSLIMGDAGLNYRGEAFAGDRLVIEVAAAEPSRCGFRLFYHVHRPSDGQEIALAETGLTCFNYEQRKIETLPPEVRQVCINS